MNIVRQKNQIGRLRIKHLLMAATTTSTADLHDICKLLKPMIDSEKVLFRDTIETIVRIKTEDAAKECAQKLEAISVEARSTRDSIDALTADALDELKGYEQEMYQGLTEDRRKLQQEFKTTKNILIQSVHRYALDELASFKDKLVAHDTVVPETVIPPEIVALLGVLHATDTAVKVAFLETFVSNVIKASFKLSPETLPMLLCILTEASATADAYATSLLSVHDESVTRSSMTHTLSGMNALIVKEFGLVGQGTHRQIEGHFLHDLIEMVHVNVVLSLAIWYGETQCDQLVSSKGSHATTVKDLEDLFRDDFGLLGLQPGENNTLVFHLDQGEGVAGYDTLGCSVVLSTDLKVQSIQIGNGRVATSDFTQSQLQQVSANIVCAVVLYQHLAQFHHSATDDTLYAFYKQDGAQNHPLRTLLDPLGVGVATQNDKSMLMGFAAHHTLFNNFTMQSPAANQHLLMVSKQTVLKPQHWPQFKRMFSNEHRPPLVEHLSIWYDAFDKLVKGVLEELEVDVNRDVTVRKWLNTLDRELTTTELRRAIVEVYFATVLHELVNHPSVADRVADGTLCTATHAVLTSSQSTFVSMLLDGTSKGTTVRYHTPYQHPWSHFTHPTLLRHVSTFQTTISTIPVDSLVHPTQVETSIAW
jgi:hypothetical protein